MSLPDPSLGQPLMCFRRAFGSRRAADRWQVDSTALVNVCLLVFMFYLASSPYVNQPAERFSIRLPESAGAQTVPYSAVIVTVTQEGMIFLGGQLHDIRDLAAGLADFERIHPDATLLIEADERVPHSRLMSIIAQARSAGVADIALATRLPDLPPVHDEAATP